MRRNEHINNKKRTDGDREERVGPIYRDAPRHRRTVGFHPSTNRVQLAAVQQ